MALMSLCQPIKLVPVPLDLSAANREVSRRVRYDLKIDYRVPPHPAELSAQDVWLDAHLRERRLRD